jgi:2-polyprenyl-3-methyl-5-hydroxy-6-metoxy-1,4-benzoquinol methylase
MYINKDLPPHLGGHDNETHLDSGVLDYMIKKYKIESYLDVGCGPGGMVELAASKGLRVMGD